MMRSRVAERRAMTAVVQLTAMATTVNSSQPCDPIQFWKDKGQQKSCRKLPAMSDYGLSSKAFRIGVNACLLPYLGPADSGYIYEA